VENRTFSLTTWSSESFWLKTWSFELETRSLGLKTRSYGLKTQNFRLKTRNFRNPKFRVEKTKFRAENAKFWIKITKYRNENSSSANPNFRILLNPESFGSKNLKIKITVYLLILSQNNVSFLLNVKIKEEETIQKSNEKYTFR
jgi:hypothetical protein